MAEDPAQHPQSPALTRELLSRRVPGELDLFAFVLVVRARLRRTILFAVLGFLLAAAYSLKVKPLYTASASSLLPQQASSQAELAVKAVSGLDLIGGGNEIYQDILKSRNIADTLIQRFDLERHYHSKDLPEAEKSLAASTISSAAKEGLLTISVTDTDPQLAAELANAYFQELERLNRHLSVNAAGQQRRYYEQELVKEKNALADSEVALKQAQEKSGVLEPQLQAQASLGAEEQTRAQLRLLQVQLGALLQGATAQNPEVIRLRSQIAATESQLQTMQSGGGVAAGNPTSRMPSQALLYVRALREVKFHEALFESLERSYEAAHLLEGKELAVIQILDPAIKPLHKSWPPRTLYSALGLVLGSLFGIFVTALEAFIGSVFRNPENRLRLDTLVRGEVRRDTTSAR